jgi:hypothetical protein
LALRLLFRPLLLLAAFPHPAFDNLHSIYFDVCPFIACVFYTGIPSQITSIEHTSTFLQGIPGDFRPNACDAASAGEKQTTINYFTTFPVTG